MTSDELPISTFSSKFLFVCYLSPKLQINFFHCPFLYSFFIQQPFFNRLSYLSSLTHTELLFTFAFPSVFGIFILPIGNKFVWHVNVYLNIINERVFQIIGFRHKILCNVSISVCLCGPKIGKKLTDTCTEIFRKLWFQNQSFPIRFQRVLVSWNHTVFNWYYATASRQVRTSRGIFSDSRVPSLDPNSPERLFRRP